MMCDQNFNYFILNEQYLGIHIMEINLYNAQKMSLFLDQINIVIDNVLDIENFSSGHRV